MTLRKNWQLIYALTLVLVVGRTWAEEKKPSKPATAPKCCAETGASQCPHGCADKCGSSSVPKSSKLVTRIHPLAAFFEAREYMEEMETPVSAVTAPPGSNTKKGDLEEQFIKLITNHIKPQSWACMGGEATVDFYSLGKALVVTATPATQEEIAKFLKELLSLTDPGMDEEEDAGFPCLPAPFGFLRMAAPLPPCCLPGPMNMLAMSAMAPVMASQPYPCPAPVCPAAPCEPTAAARDAAAYDPHIVAQQFQPQIVTQPYQPQIVTQQYQPQIVAQQFQPFGFINGFSPHRFLEPASATAAPEMLPPPRLAMEPPAPVMQCVAVPPPACPTAACVVRARCEGGKTRLEMENSCMALHAMCETMELKTAGSDSLKLTAQENQIHIDGHAFRASADSLKCNGGATWVLEGHVQFSYKQDGTSAVIRGDHVVLSLNKGQVDFRLGNTPRMPPAVVQPAAYHWAPN